MLKFSQKAILLLILLLLGCTKASVSTDATATPLEKLLNGNSRYAEQHPIHPDQTLERLRDLKKGQRPFAVVVSCSDSRVPPELIFDQGLGDLFVIRTAGNVIGDYELGSIEYAVEHLKTSLVMVLGHENCGAVSAFIEHKHDTLSNHIQAIVNYLKAEKEEMALDENRPDYLAAAVRANVVHGVNLLKTATPTLKNLVEKKEIQIVGAVYDLDDGKITIIK